MSESKTNAGQHGPKRDVKSDAKAPKGKAVEDKRNTTAKHGPRQHK